MATHLTVLKSKRWSLWDFTSNSLRALLLVEMCILESCEHPGDWKKVDKAQLGGLTWSISGIVDWWYTKVSVKQGPRAVATWLEDSILLTSWRFNRPVVQGEFGQDSVHSNRSFQQNVDSPTFVGALRNLMFQPESRDVRIFTVSDLAVSTRWTWIDFMDPLRIEAVDQGSYGSWGNANFKKEMCASYRQHVPASEVWSWG